VSTTSLRRIAPAAIGAGLALYVAMHSPLRDPVLGLAGFERETCFFCDTSLAGFDLPGSLPGSELGDALAAAVLIVLATAGGWAVAARFDWALHEKLLAFGLATVALVTIPAAAVGGIASLVGEAYLRPPGGLLLTAIPSLAVVLVAARRGWSLAPPRGVGIPRSFLVRAILAVGVLLLLVEVIVTLTHPPSQGDALSYHAPLEVLFWADGNLTSVLDRSPETWALAHPGAAELWYGVFGLLGGERLANVGQLPFALLGAGAVFAFARRTGLRRDGAALAGAAFLLVPMVVLQVGTQANDLAGAALFMVGFALACAPVAEWRADRLAMIGLALGLAGATKLALLPSVGAVAAYVLLAVLRRPGPARDRVDRAAAVVFGVAFLAAVIPWWARNVIREGNPIFPQSIPLYGHGFEVGGGPEVDFDFVERRPAWPIYPFIEPIDDRSGYGALLAIAIVPGLWLAWKRARRAPLVLFGASFAVTLVFWWAYSLHEPRFLLPYAGLALALLPWALRAVPQQRRRLAGALVLAAAAFSVAVTLDQQVLPLARQPVDRAAFYDRVYGVDPVAQSLPEDEGVLVLTGFGHGPVDYTSYYPMLGPSQDRHVLLLDADTAEGDTGVVVNRMKEGEVEYAYVQVTPEFRKDARELFARHQFELVHRSAFVLGERIGVRRTLYRPATGAEGPEAIRRYVFRLTAAGA
jgi:hypothetical protein